MGSKADKSFVFKSFLLDPETKTAVFEYALNLNGEETKFTETLSFPKNLNWKKVPAELINNALQNLHLALGASYWKTYCPKILVEGYPLDKKSADFWTSLYTKGMGEFFYKNKIDFRKLVKFPYELHPVKSALPQLNYAKSGPASLDLTGLGGAKQFNRVKAKDRSLLLFGGGKDSLVSAELLEKAGKKFTYFFVASGGIADVVHKLLPKDSIVIQRKIDPKLFELNKNTGVLNGHIPITSLIVFIAELAALLYDYKYVVASNERSSSYGNLNYLGLAVNHQWSKSLEAEKLIQDQTKRSLGEAVNFFSILRPLYEIKILEIFSHYPKYFNKFSSCNRNFKVISRNRIVGWCGECPKCAFVFAMLSAFISKKQLIRMYGKNMYEETSLISLFQELLGIIKFKPFECVGTPEEMAVAMGLAVASGEYDNSPVIEMFIREVLPGIKNPEKVYDRVMNVNREHLVPKEFVKIIKNI